jgi:hypothetical protein
MLQSMKSLLALAACAVLVPETSGCKCGTSTTVTETTPSASSRVPLAPPVAPRVPTGPRFAVLAGKGIGPIRIGATLATVERLMELPCPDRAPSVCRYIDRGVEFRFGDDGKVKRILIHRGDREAPNARLWGPFNGGIPPDLRFGMIIPAIQQFLGPPQKVVQGNEGAAREAVVQHYYEGMVLEYDRAPNGKLILGGIRIPE